MPFIVDLPPPDFESENTKIEQVIIDGQKHFSDDDFGIYKIDRDMFEDVYFKEKFESLLIAWKDNTMLHSSISKIIEDKNFVELLKMNKKVLLPLIIDEIEKEPSILVWALNIITEHSFNGEHRNTIEDVCKKWVKLYRQGKINFV